MPAVGPATLPPIAFSFEAVETFERIVRGFSREGSPRTNGYCVQLVFADGTTLDAHLDCLTDGGLCVREHIEGSDEMGPMHTVPLDEIARIMVY